MAGGPSQLDLFDYKPLLNQKNGEELPDSVAAGPAAHRHVGQPGVAAARRLAASSSRSTARAARGSASCCRTPRRSSTTSASSKSMYTEAINHDPAITFFQTGSQIAGRPSMGAWLSLRPRQRRTRTCRRSSCWSSRGAGRPAALRAAVGQRLPADSQHQGVQFRRGKDPVLYLGNPDGVSPRRPRSDARPARASCTRTQSETQRRSGDRRRASRSTRWRSACRRACRR